MPKKKDTVQSDAVDVTLASAPRPLVTVANKIRSLFHALNKRDLETRYAIAVLVKHVQEDAKYGEGAVEALARELADVELEAQTLRNYALVPKTFEKKEFVALGKRRGGPEAKFVLTWSHFQVLAAVADGRKRARLIRETLDECLSVERLRNRVPVQPASPAAPEAAVAGEEPAVSEVDRGEPDTRQVADIGRTTRALTSDVQAWLGAEKRNAEAVFGELAKLPPAEVKAPVLKDLESLEREFSNLRAFADEGYKRTEELLARFRQPSARALEATNRRQGCDGPALNAPDVGSISTSRSAGAR